jgi:hypothetical protein
MSGPAKTYAYTLLIGAYLSGLATGVGAFWLALEIFASGR